MAYIGNSPANVGNYQIVDNVASSFNGSLTSFALASGGITITPAKSGQLLVGVNGVMQQPDDTGTNGFKVSGSNIVFSSAPASGDTFWAVYQGQEVDIGVPSDDVVDTIHIKDNAITTAKLAPNAVIASDIADNSITNAKLADDAVDSAEIADGAVDLVHMSSESVDEDNLQISNAGTNGQFLSKQSGNTGGLTWADVDALPSQSGHAGKYLTTDATNASWGTLDTDANTTTKGLYEMAHTISANYTITTNNNAISAGPITINSSISVTIPSGSTWVIA
jgi:hypothetical protein